MQISTGVLDLQSTFTIGRLTEVKDSRILPTTVDPFVTGDDDTFGSRTIQVVHIRGQQIVLSAE